MLLARGPPQKSEGLAYCGSAREAAAQQDIHERDSEPATTKKHSARGIAFFDPKQVRFLTPEHVPSLRI